MKPTEELIERYEKKVLDLEEDLAYRQKRVDEVELEIQYLKVIIEQMIKELEE